MTSTAQAQDQTTDFEKAILHWLCTGEKGVSSETMALILLGANVEQVKSRWLFNHPEDPDDFRRCHLFLESVPGAREQLHKLKPISDTWARLVDNWDRLTELYEEEKHQDQAPKLFAMLQDIETEAQK